jgi:hypothetical protein
MKNDPELSYWAVAFIDLLGQNAKLARMTHLPTNEKEMEVFRALFRETFAATNELHERFKANFEMLSRKDPSTELPPEITNEQFAKLRTGKVKFQRFSDGLVAFVSLKNADDILPMNGIAALLGTLGILFPDFLAKGIPLRCGVDVGIGMEMNPNELYGPAVRNAYHMESRIAQYPRIVLGKEIILYMRDYIPKIPDGSREASVSKVLAKHWLDRCVEDVDGYPILDYLGELFLADVNVKELGGYNYEEALKFIIAELNQHKANQDTKLAFRYILLHDYFQSHRKNWLDN